LPYVTLSEDAFTTTTRSSGGWTAVELLSMLGACCVLGATGQTGSVRSSLLCELAGTLPVVLPPCGVLCAVTDLVLGAPRRLTQAMVRELLGGSEQRATRVVAYGCSRMPTYSGARQELFEPRQATMEALSTSRSGEITGFDTLFVHVGTQRGKVGLEVRVHPRSSTSGSRERGWREGNAGGRPE